MVVEIAPVKGLLNFLDKIWCEEVQLSYRTAEVRRGRRLLRGASHCAQWNERGTRETEVYERPHHRRVNEFEGWKKSPSNKACKEWQMTKWANRDTGGFAL